MTGEAPTIMWIVSASGPRLEKAYKGKFYLSEPEARRVAVSASVELVPTEYEAYRMLVEPFDGDEES